MKLFQAIECATKLLFQAGIDLPRLEARILLEGILHKGQEWLLLHQNIEISVQDENNYFYNINRRCERYPVAYLLGYKEFYSREFIVNESVLIPRPDSETLIEAVLKDIPKSSLPMKILELGVGSGCLIITLLLELPCASGVASDISLAALEVASLNRSKYHLDNRLVIKHSDWFEKIGENKFDIIISNPPYISQSEQEKMSLDTAYEPKLALFSKEKNGLDSYEIIASEGARFLKANGFIYLEIGSTQARSVENIFANHGWVLSHRYQDLAGHDRCLKFYKR